MDKAALKPTDYGRQHNTKHRQNVFHTLVFVNKQLISLSKNIPISTNLLLCASTWFIWTDRNSTLSRRACKEDNGWLTCLYGLSIGP